MVRLVGNCDACGRRFSVTVPDQTCCGNRVRLQPGEPLVVQKRKDSAKERLRKHFREAIKICDRCGNQESCHRCALLPKVNLQKHLMAGGGCPVGKFCGTDDEFPLSADVVSKWKSIQQSPIGLVAVTSLSPRDHHEMRQRESLKSWKRTGLSIAVLNRSSELLTLRGKYPEVDHWIANDDVGQEYRNPTQPIKRLAEVSRTLDSPVLIINSDVEIYGDQKLLTAPLAKDKQLAAIRWNYSGTDYSTAKREQWGIDAFSFTPEQAESLPGLPLSIGRPFWDYWIPYHARHVGQAMHFVGEPLLFHQSHGIYWSESDWCRGCEWVCHHYGTQFDPFAKSFRQSLPFAPKDP